MGMSRWVILAALIGVCALILGGCSPYGPPKVVLEPTNYRYDYTDIPLRDGHRFAEDAMEIRETEAGYDIIIHVEAEHE